MFTVHSPQLFHTYVHQGTRTEYHNVQDDRRLVDNGHGLSSRALSIRGSRGMSL